MKYLVFFFAIILPACDLFAQVQDYSWAVSGNSTIEAASVDPDGNIFIIGGFAYTGSFGPRIEQQNIPSKGMGDMFIEKLDTNGAVLWYKIIGSENSENCRALTLDSSGNIYLIGDFWGELDFDPGPNVVNRIPSSEGFDDVFVLKLDKLGNFVWVQTFGCHTFDNGISIDVDDSMNVYVTGMFGDNINDMDPGPEEYTLESFGSDDIFVMKMNPLGEMVWVRSMGGDGMDKATNIDVDTAGNIYVSGGFREQAYFAPGVYFTAIGTSWDGYIQKLSPDGDNLWVYAAPGPNDNRILEIELDPEGNLFALGGFFDSLDVDTGPGIIEVTSAGNRDVLLQKMTSQGEVIWARSIGNEGENEVSGMDVDTIGNAYIAGRFKGAMNVGSESEPFICQGIANHQNSFVQRWDTDGNTVWGKAILSDEFYTNCSDIVSDGTGNIYATGVFNQKAYIVAPNEEHTLLNKNDMTPSSDNFLIRWGYPANHISWFDPFYSNDLDIITVYPNPTMGDIEVKQSGLFDLKIEMFDYLGRRLFETSTSALQTSFDISNFSAGSYSMRFRYLDKTVVQYIVKL